MIELTQFNSILDVNAHKKQYRFGDWSEFRRCLYKLSKFRGYKPSKEELINKTYPKYVSSLITPAVYKKVPRRKNENVTRWGRWAALDVDDYNDSFEAAVHQFTDYNFVCYSSASSRKEHPKFRIVLELDRNVEHDEIRHFWHALNKEFGEINDPQTKDLSRMYYIPALYDNAYNFIFHNEGKAIGVDHMKDRHEYVASGNDLINNDQFPQSIREELEKMKLNSLTNNGRKNITWSSYKDCPFVHDILIKEYASIAYIDNSGRYHFIYRIISSIAFEAVKAGYPITPDEIVELCREIDRDYGHRYKHRNMHTEAKRAISYAISKSKFSLAL